MKFIKSIKFCFFLSILGWSTNVLCDDITCPVGFPKKVALKNVDLKKESISSKQELVKLEFDNEYLNEKLTSAVLVVGEWKYNTQGELLSKVGIEASLDVESKSKKSKVKFVKSKSMIDAVKVIINYGNQCGYRMEVDVIN